MSLPEPMPSPMAVRANPFKGLAYYERQDAGRFAGRQRDIEAVAAGILRTRTFVVYGRSGLGKTSLLLAGVLPRLGVQGCRTLDVRLLEDPLGDLRRVLAGPDTDGTEDLATLVERAGGDQLLVVVFDQFEEFFIRFADQADPAGGLRSGDELDRQARQQRIAQRETFIEEIGRLAADARLNLRLVFSLREDWIAEMGDFADAVPEITQHMYRLLPLTSFGARQAIVETLRSAGTDFDSRLVSTLVEALADVHFDPAMLQVLGSEVWERTRARTPEGEVVRLELTDLEAIGGVKQVFRGYLDQIQSEIEPTDRRRRILTRAVLDVLISEKRTKLALSREDLLRQYFVITEPELDEVLDRLYRHRLIRSDPRGDVRWYELVHERLIGAILEWFETDLDFFKLRSARNLLTNSCRNRGWRENPELLLNRGQIDDTVGPFKDLLRFDSEERVFLVSSAIYAHSRDLEFWAELAGSHGITGDLLDRFLDQADNERLRLRAAEAAGRVAKRPQHFARRCLELALHDPSAEVRHAAARSFADLASLKEHQTLAAQLWGENRQAALDVLTEVVDKERLPDELKLGYSLRVARRRVSRRRLEAAGSAIREKGRRGALTGLLAGLLWAVTAGVFLTRMALYEWLPEIGVEPWIWPLGIGAYLVAALPLGAWAGWRTARRLAQAAVTRGREGASFEALGFGPISMAGIATFLVWAEISWLEISYRAADNVLDLEPAGLYIVGLVSAAGLGVMLWTALSVVLGMPAVRPASAPRRSSWVWAWIWAFGSSLLVLSLVPILKNLYELGSRDRRGDASMSMLSRFLVDSGALSLFAWVVAVLLLGGLLSYAGLVSAMAFSTEPSPRSRMARRSLGIALAVLSCGLYVHSFGVDGLPFLAEQVTLGTEDISRELEAPFRFDTVHLELRAPGNASSPRLVEVRPIHGIHVSTRGLDNVVNPAFVLQPGESRHLAFWDGPGRVLIRPDRPLFERSPAESPQLIVARLRRGGGAIELDHFVRKGQRFSLSLGHMAQGKCEDAGITVSLWTPLKTVIGLPCAPRRLEQIFFSDNYPWTPGNNPPRLTVRMWQSVSLPHGNSVEGAFSPDGTHVATAFRGLEAHTPPEARVAYIWPSDGSVQGRIELFPSIGTSFQKVAFSPDGRLLAMLGRELFVQILKVDGSVDPLSCLAFRANSMAFSPDGTKLATIGGNFARICRTDKRMVGQFEIAHPIDFYPSISFDGEKVVTVDLDGTLSVWSATDPGTPLSTQRVPLRSLALGPSISGVNFSPDGTRLAVLFEDRVQVWNVENLDAPVVTLRPPLPAKLAVFNRDSSRILTTFDRGSVLIWNADGSGKPVRIPALADQATFSPDGSLVATALENEVRIWKSDGSAEPIVLIHEASILKLQFNKDGSRLLAIPRTGPARIWAVKQPLSAGGEGDIFLFLRVSSGRS